MAILLHAVLNASTRLWNTLPEYSVEPPTAAEAAAQTVHINLMMTIVMWVAAVRTRPKAQGDETPSGRYILTSRASSPSWGWLRGFRRWTSPCATTSW
jgi:hypothetical protein